MKKDIIEVALIDGNLKNGYEEEYRKIRTPQPKIDNALVPNFLNFDINNIENENDKKFVNHCLNILNVSKLKNYKQQEKNIFLKKCVIWRKARNDEEVLVFCNKCYDNSIKNALKT